MQTNKDYVHVKGGKRRDIYADNFLGASISLIGLSFLSFYYSDKPQFQFQ